MSETNTAEPEVKKPEEPKEDDGLEYREGATPEQKEIYRLHQENKTRRHKIKELEAETDKLKAEQKEREEAKLKEDGKLKELLEAKEKELEGLKGLKEENEQHKEFFTKQLETALDKLSETQKELINDSEMSIPKKLEWALKLAGEKLSKIDSPDSRRPGGDAPEPDVDLEEYTGPEGRKKLLKLRDTNKDLYEKILELKNQL
nr:hypothetical protein 19 [Legionellales bacterium]